MGSERQERPEDDPEEGQPHPVDEDPADGGGDRGDQVDHGVGGGGEVGALSVLLLEEDQPQGDEGEHGDVVEHADEEDHPQRQREVEDIPDLDRLFRLHSPVLHQPLCSLVDQGEEKRA